MDNKSEHFLFQISNSVSIFTRKFIQIEKSETLIINFCDNNFVNVDEYMYSKIC